jgi:hypothetical protein
MNFLKRTLPLLIVFITGATLIFCYYSPRQGAEDIITNASSWYQIIVAFTLVLGVASLMRSHYTKIKRKEEGYGYSWVMYIALIITAVFGLIPVTEYSIDAKEIKDPASFLSQLNDESNPISNSIVSRFSDDTKSGLDAYDGSAEVPEDLLGLVLSDLNNLMKRPGVVTIEMLEAVELSESTMKLATREIFGEELVRLNRFILEETYPGTITASNRSGYIFGDKTGSIFIWIFDSVNSSAASTVFSILAFYIASAAYRAFRIRTFDATVMLIAALIVMAGRIPLGEMFSNSLPEYLPFLRLDTITSFLLSYPVTAAKRAIFLGLSLSIVATSLRVILGIERTYLGGTN